MEDHLAAFLMQIVGGSSPAAIMNVHRSLPRELVGNKERNNRPIARVKNIKIVECKI
jgi:hypothetical protein